MTLLTIEHLVKEYRPGARANDDISLSVEPGEVYGLLGPNGAGKTTLVNQVVGLIAPTSGRVTLSGVDVVAHPDHARRHCSLQPQAHAPVDGFTLRQAVELIGRMRGGDKTDVARRADDLFEALEITEWRDKTGQQLSGGVRRLAAFCMAVVVPGELVILDEPTNDVDPLRRRLLWGQVRAAANQGAAVLLVTHNVLEAERSVDRLAIINHGRVAAAGTAASLKQQDLDLLRLELILEPEGRFPSLPSFLSAPVNTGRRLIARVESKDVNRAVSWAQQLREAERIEEFSLGPATLEDVYVRIVGRQQERTATELEVHHGLSTALA